MPPFLVRLLVAHPLKGYCRVSYRHAADAVKVIELLGLVVAVELGVRLLVLVEQHSRRVEVVLSSLGVVAVPSHGVRVHDGAELLCEPLLVGILQCHCTHLSRKVIHLLHVANAGAAFLESTLVLPTCMIVDGSDPVGEVVHLTSFQIAAHRHQCLDESGVSEGATTRGLVAHDLSLKGLRGYYLELFDDEFDGLRQLHHIPLIEVRW